MSASVALLTVFWRLVLFDDDDNTTTTTTTDEGY